MKLMKQKLYGITLILLSIIIILFANYCEEDCGWAVIIGIPLGVWLIFSRKSLLTSDIEDDEES